MTEQPQLSARGAAAISPHMSATINRVRQLISEGRYMAARKECEAVGINAESVDLTPADRSVVELVLQRCSEAENAFTSTEGSDWTLGSEFNGIKTTYRRESDDSISVCTEGHFFL